MKGPGTHTYVYTHTHMQVQTNTRTHRILPSDSIHVFRKTAFEFAAKQAHEDTDPPIDSKRPCNLKSRTGLSMIDERKEPFSHKLPVRVDP